MVGKRLKSKNIKPINRQKLIEIVSNGWRDVPDEIIRKSFELAGVLGEFNNLFLNHHPEFKKRYLQLEIN